MTDELTRSSRFLSYVLRHHPEAIGIALDEAGWVRVPDLLDALARHGRPVSPELLDRLVAGAGKRRLEVKDDRIRAAQGHSVPVDLQLDPVQPPRLLYHGTVARFLPAIRAEGLTRQARRHVHLSADQPAAAAVARRRGEPLVLTVDSDGMYRAGHAFYRAANEVWLTDRVPPEWIRFPGPH